MKLRLAAAAVAAINYLALAAWRFGNNVINLIRNGESPMVFLEKGEKVKTFYFAQKISKKALHISENKRSISLLYIKKVKLALHEIFLKSNTMQVLV